MVCKIIILLLMKMFINRLSSNLSTEIKTIQFLSPSELTVQIVNLFRKILVIH